MLKQVLYFTYLLTLGISNTFALSQHNLSVIEENQAVIFKTSKSTLSQFVKKNNADNEVILDLHSSDITDSDMPAIIDFLKTHTDIHALSLAGNSKLNIVSVLPLVEIKSLYKIDLSLVGVSCDNRQCKSHLSLKDLELFVSSSHIVELGLEMQNIGDDGAQILASSHFLRKLNLTANVITNIGIDALAKNQYLQELKLRANKQISDKGAIALAKNPALKSLDLSRTNISDMGAIALSLSTSIIKLSLESTNITDTAAHALAKNTRLKKLNLSYNSISVTGAKVLAENKTLVKLILENDYEQNSKWVGDEGAAFFANNNTLESLDLGGQNISAKGAAELVKNSHLHTLELPWNTKIGDEGATYLATSKNIKHLNLIDCRIGDKGAKALATSSITTMNLMVNWISDAGAYAFAKDSHILGLNLWANQIHDEGAMALGTFGSMHSLSVQGNPISKIGITALKNNTKIKHLYY